MGHEEANLTGISVPSGRQPQPRKTQRVDAVDSRPRWPSNSEEDDEAAEMHDDYVDHGEDEAKEMARTHDESMSIVDQLFAEAAQPAVEASKKSEDMEAAADILDFIGAKRTCNSEISKWYEGSKSGMVSKKGDKGIG